MTLWSTPNLFQLQSPELSSRWSRSNNWSTWLMVDDLSLLSCTCLRIRVTADSGRSCSKPSIATKLLLRWQSSMSCSRGSYSQAFPHRTAMHIPGSLHCHWHWQYLLGYTNDEIYHYLGPWPVRWIVFRKVDGPDTAAAQVQMASALHSPMNLPHHPWNKTRPFIGPPLKARV